MKGYFPFQKMASQLFLSEVGQMGLISMLSSTIKKMLVKVSVFIQLTKYNFGNVTVEHPKEGQGYKARSKSPHGVICRLGSLEKGKKN